MKDVVLCSASWSIATAIQIVLLFFLRLPIQEDLYVDAGQFPQLLASMIHIFKASNDIGELKVNEPKKARKTKSAKTEDAEQITKPTGRKSRNSKKAGHCDAEIN